jgi:hypothetical protein
MVSVLTKDTILKGPNLNLESDTDSLSELTNSLGLLVRATRDDGSKLGGQASKGTSLVSTPKAEQVSDNK